MNQCKFRARNRGGLVVTHIARMNNHEKLDAARRQLRIVEVQNKRLRAQNAALEEANKILRNEIARRGGEVRR